MAHVFRLIKATEVDKKDETGVYIGIDLRIADQQIPCPVSGLCRTKADLEAAQQEIEKDLAHIMVTARDLFKGVGNAEPGDTAISPDMSPQETWEVLSRIEDEDRFIVQFNQLPEDKRMKVAEHVLTQCNVFQGRASFFAQRYDNLSGLMA